MDEISDKLTRITFAGFRGQQTGEQLCRPPQSSSVTASCPSKSQIDGARLTSRNFGVRIGTQPFDDALLPYHKVILRYLTSRSSSNTFFGSLPRRDLPMRSVKDPKRSG